jgi:hypothetical protein
MPRTEHLPASAHMPPETPEGRSPGRLAFRAMALALAVLFLGASVTPANCAATAFRWMGVTASRVPGDCCGDAAGPAGTGGVSLTQGPQGSCCPPGGPCRVTRVPRGSEAAPPEGTSRAGASETPGRDVDRFPSPPRHGPGRTSRLQPTDRQLYLRTGVLRV